MLSRAYDGYIRKGYPANLILTWKYRRHLDPKVCLPSAVLVLAGSIPGAIMLKNVEDNSYSVGNVRNIADPEKSVN